MAQYLIDSDVLIDVLRTRRALEKILRVGATDADSLLISTVTVAELFAGASAQHNREQRRISDLIDKFDVVAVSRDIAELAGRLKYHHGLLLADALIAASAMSNRATLVTKNLKHYRGIAALKLLT